MTTRSIESPAPTAELAAARRAAGLSAKELARRIGISLWELQRLERGEGEIEPQVRRALEEQLAWSPPDEEAIEPGPRAPAGPPSRTRGPEKRAARERQRAVAERDRGDPARDARTVAALEQQEKRVAEDREELDRRSEELASRAAELDAEREGTAAGAEELETERQATIAEAERIRRDLEESRDALRERERDLLRRENELELERKRTQAASDRAAETLAEARAQVDARDEELARRSDEIEEKRRRKNVETKRLLTRSRRELDEAWARATVAERRVAQLEAAGGQPDAAAEPARRSEPEPEAGGAVPGEAAGIAEVGFADLRRMGLSITQAKRVLRYRDERGELRSADDLERVPGLTEDLRERVRRELTP